MSIVAEDGWKYEGGSVEYKGKRKHSKRNESLKGRKNSTRGGLSLKITEPTLTEEDIRNVFDLEDNHMKYYRENFLEVKHMNFLGTDPQFGAISISILKDEKSKQYKSVIRAIEGHTRITVPFDHVRFSAFRRIFNLGPSSFDILRTIVNESKLQINISKLKEIHDPRLPQALLNLEEKQTVKGFKFGLLYAKEGQTKEDELFSNEGSPEFEEFLDFLGKRVKLKDWNHFSGGLDIKRGSTGKMALFQKWRNNECMFHVSTLLPYSETDKQQLERKRHIGNDLVVIVFLDKNAVWKPSYLTSRQIHVVILVQEVFMKKDPEEVYYQLGVISKEGVVDFGPTIPKNTVYKRTEELRDFLYTKLCNAEKASYNSPLLNVKFQRTRQSLLEDVVQQFAK